MKIVLPEFSTQKELIDFVVKNKMEIIDMKKSAIKFADSSSGLSIPAKEFIAKSSTDSQDTEDVIYRTIVGNTYNWMDSHDDAHLNNLFGQSIKDRNGRIYHRHDHINQLTAKVGKFSKVYEQTVNWTDVGVEKIGQTMALLGDSAIKRAYNQLIFDSYKDGEIDQHSVGMRYIKLFLGVNDHQYREEFETWNKYAPLLGNIDKAIKRGFCFFIKEAALIEISCVTEGSNELTGMYNPAKASVTIDPPSSSQKSVWDIYI